MLDSPQRTPIAHAPISLILLASGPTSAVAESVSVWNAYLATLDRAFELIVLQIVTASASGDEPANPVFANVRCVEHDAALGFGPALAAVIRSARYPLVMLSAADRQFEPADLGCLLGAIDNVDLAVGCRAVAAAPAWRWWIGRAARLVGRVVLSLPQMAAPGVAGATPWRRRWAARWAFGVHVLDPESPFRLGRRDALVRIVLQSQGTFALIEQLAKANHLEFVMTEEPVAWSPPSFVPLTPVLFARELRELFRNPDFGPPELHISGSDTSGPNPDAVPTNPVPPSS